MDELFSLVEHYGLLLVWLNVLLTQLGLPLPASPTLVVAGAFAARDALSWPTILTGAVAASVLADCVWYLLGLRFGSRLLDRLSGRLPAGTAARVETFFDRWGVVTLAMAKLVPGFALLAPPIAGMARMHPLSFVLASGAGAALWAGIPIGFGMHYQDAVHLAIAALGQQATWAATLAGLSLAAALAIGRRLR